MSSRSDPAIREAELLNEEAVRHVTPIEEDRLPHELSYPVEVGKTTQVVVSESSGIEAMVPYPLNLTSELNCLGMSADVGIREEKVVDAFLC